jgi:hypothetical protein
LSFSCVLAENSVRKKQDLVVESFVANFVALDCLLVPREAVSIPALFLRDNTSGMYVSMDHGQTADKAAADTPGCENRHVQSVVRQAERELRQLNEERAEITKRIGSVKQTIVGLAKIFGDDILDAALLDLVDRKSGSCQPGITRACRRVLMEAGRPMSARDVCDEIQRTVPELLARHKDPMATINTILGRLVKYGEAIALPGDRGQRAWLWAAERDGRSSRAPDGEGSGPAA